MHDGGPNGWAAALAPHGYTTVAIPGQISASALANVDVLIVGEAGAVIYPAEVEAVRQWVEAGHGLLMVGVAWFWDQSHPGKFESFPMNVLAAPYGLRWAHGGMSDPTNNLDGSPIFHTFYPDVLRPDRAASIAAIDDVGNEFPPDVEPSIANGTAVILAHEMNHQVPGVGDELVAPCSQNRIRSNRVAVDPSQRSRLDRRDRGERASLSLRDRRCGAGHRLRRRRRAVCGAAAGRARSHRPRCIDGVDRNDSVTLSGRATLALAPAPIANGLRVIVCGPSGALVDVSLPAGAYEPVDVRERFLDRRRLQPRHGAHHSQG